MQCSKISWLNGGNTFNPWIGCAPVSPACAYCYARRENDRRKWCSDFNRERHVTSDAYWRQPIAWNKVSDPARPTLVFCGSLCDVFERDTALYEPRRRLFDLISATPNLLWLLLTKRPENFHNLLVSDYVNHSTHGLGWHWLNGEYPQNVWLGVTVENRATADLRIPTLLSVPCAGRFVSCEPLLDFVTLTSWFSCFPRLDWVIAGGERGPHSRETTFFQFESLAEQCAGFSVPFFFKQYGDAFSALVDRVPAPPFERHEFPERFGIK